jgi:hypothetical protein
MSGPGTAERHHGPFPAGRVPLSPARMSCPRRDCTQSQCMLAGEFPVGDRVMTGRPDGQTRWTTAECVAVLALIAAGVSYLHRHELVPGRSGGWYAIWYWFRRVRRHVHHRERGS